MRHALRGTLAAIAGCAALAACSNHTDGPDTFSALRSVAGQVAGRVTGHAGADQPATPPDPEVMAAEALRANPAPLLLVTLEEAGVTQVMAMTGENGTMRTWMNPAMQGLITRNGMLVGTRGILGHDLATTRAGTEAAIRSRQPGRGRHMLYPYGGDGDELPMPFECEVTRGPDRSFTFAGRQWHATLMNEGCRWGTLEVANSYLVTADGQIPLSRQWAGPGLGYMTLQVIRP